MTYQEAVIFIAEKLQYFTSPDFFAPLYQILFLLVFFAGVSAGKR